MCSANKLKREKTNNGRIELPDQERIRTLREKENNMYLGSKHNPTNGDEKNNKQYRKRMRKRFQTTFCSRNLIKEMNTRIAPCKINGTILEMDLGRTSTN